MRYSCNGVGPQTIWCATQSSYGVLTGGRKAPQERSQAQGERWCFAVAMNRTAGPDSKPLSTWRSTCKCISPCLIIHNNRQPGFTRMATTQVQKQQHIIQVQIP